MALIYQFTMYDILTDSERKSRRWGTRESIDRIGGTIVEGSPPGQGRRVTNTVCAVVKMCGERISAKLGNYTIAPFAAVPAQSKPVVAERVRRVPTT